MKGKGSATVEIGRARGAEREGRAAPPGLVRRARARKIIAVGGGKGGIGKSLVSANLSIALAAQGRRVALVDADLGGANLHTCLGVTQPSATLSDYVHRRAAKLEDIQVDCGIENLSLIAGAQDVLDAANLKYAQKQKLLRNLQTLDVDYLVLDLGAGTSFNTLDFFLLADHGLLVLLPEPTSVENAYRFVKAAFFRKLQNLGSELGLEDVLEDAMTSRQGAVSTPFEFIEQVRMQDPEAGAMLERELKSFRVRLVVNQVRGEPDRHVGPAVVSAWKKFFGLEMEYLGCLQYDDQAWRAVRKRRPLLLEAPDSPASLSLRALSERLIQIDAHPGS